MTQTIHGLAILGTEVTDIDDGTLHVHVEDTRHVDASAIIINTLQITGIRHQHGHSTRIHFQLDLTKNLRLNQLSVRAFLIADGSSNQLQVGDCVSTQSYRASDPDLQIILCQIN